MSNQWTGGQYSIYRGLLGAFIIGHFAMLIPYGAEVFGRGGLIESAALSPYFGSLPNPLMYFDQPFVVTALLGVGVGCGIALAVGWFDRCAALMAAVLLSWLFQRNPMIANPSLPLFGFLLVVHTFVPVRPSGSIAAYRAGGGDLNWRLPEHLQLAVWIVLALSYSHSGITKLLSASWVSGDAIRLVLENPLARDHALRELVLALPPITLKLLTWTVLGVEVLFAPLVLFKRVRPFIWAGMLIAQLGFLCFLNFADLTFPMLLVHLVTFDPSWLKRWSPKGKGVLLFDGHCALCFATVRLAVSEDANNNLSFAALESELGRKMLGKIDRKWKGDTIILVDDRGYAIKSRAVAATLEHVGGLWWLVAKVIRVIPRPIADAVYDLVGRARYHLAGRVQNVCELLPAERFAK